MKIAVYTEDGKTISQHFGRARYYKVFTIQDGEIADSELREKLGHAQFQAEGDHQRDHQDDHSGDSQDQHSYGAAAQSKHARMAAVISDCRALLCRSMDWGAYESMKEQGIMPIVTDFGDIDDAVQAYVDDTIVDLTDRLH